MKSWWAPAFGLIVGSAPGAAGDKDSEEKSGQGYFAPFGIGMWLYGGVSAGLGESVGPYVTTGPMIGTTVDWAVGGGIHFKGIGLGVVLPVGETVKAMNRHHDTVAYLLTQGSYLVQHAQYYAGEAMQTLSQLGGLEQLVTG
ncbi:MAG: hypothetical protein HY619_00800 [Thaumarchaeota archaeon]|nr:hypothetical protein [Nitrososphaerota archaeon]